VLDCNYKVQFLHLALASGTGRFNAGDTDTDV
jgi:hypothetical protein